MSDEQPAWRELLAADSDTASGPRHRRIYRAVAAAVLEGRLAPGARLPSTRSLAAQLGVARGTVDVAYHTLAVEGYVVSRGAAGTFVTRSLPGIGKAGSVSLAAARTATQTATDTMADIVNDMAGDKTPARQAPAPATEAATRRLEHPAPRAAHGAPRESRPRALAMGVPALDAFPARLWARLVSRHARAINAESLDHQPPAGHEPLRRQIAAYLAVARGIACSPEQVVITNGFQGAVGLIASALLERQDTVLVEDPGYPRTRDAFRLAGARIEGVPVDDEGVRSDMVAARSGDAHLLVLTPTHQYPLGHTLSLSRRVELLEWAARTDTWIVEDDYDGEYRYDGPPLPALKSLDRRGRVLYAGTFSKVLSPSPRLGYLVVPEEIAAPIVNAAAHFQPPPPTLVQAAMATFLEEGHLGRHIRRMRQLYGERRNALRDALGEAAPGLRIARRPGGLHLIAELPAGSDDAGLCGFLRLHGFAPDALSEAGVARPYFPGLLLGFANVPVEEAAETARRFAAVLVEAALQGVLPW